MPTESGTTVPTPAGLRPLYGALGILCTAIGLINHLIPGMPSTVFYLVALWAFKRSSPRLEHWLLWKSPMGPALRDWEQDRSMSMRNKVLAITFVWVGILSSIAILVFRNRPMWVSILLLVVAVSLTVYLATRKTKMVVQTADESEPSPIGVAPSRS